MKRFRNDQEQKKKFLQKAAQVLLLPVFVIFVIITAVQSHTYETGSLRLVPSLIMVFGPILLFLLFSFRMRKQMRNSFDQFQLRIDGSGIEREGYNVNKVRIERKDISRIVSNSKGFSIYGNSKNSFISIPRYVEKPQELERLLSKFQSIEKGSNKNMLVVKIFGLTTLFFLCFASIQLLDQLSIVLPMSLVFLAGSAWFASLLWKSEILPPKLKRSAFFLLIPVIAVFARLVELLQA